MTVGTASGIKQGFAESSAVEKVVRVCRHRFFITSANATWIGAARRRYAIASAGPIGWTATSRLSQATLCSVRRLRQAVVLAARHDVRFSNRPVGVKRFQTIHHCSVDVAHGLVLLFGIGTKALPSWDSKTRRNNLWVGLAVR